MASPETEARIERAREGIAAALREFAEAKVQEIKEDEPDNANWAEILAGPGALPFITGWAVVMEYTNTWMERNHRSACITAVPEGQSYAHGLGLFTYAAKEF